MTDPEKDQFTQKDIHVFLNVPGSIGQGYSQ